MKIIDAVKPKHRTKQLLRNSIVCNWLEKSSLTIYRFYKMFLTPSIKYYSSINNCWTSRVYNRNKDYVLLCLQRNKRQCGWYSQRATEGFIRERIQSLSQQTKAGLCRGQQTFCEQHRLLWYHLIGISWWILYYVWLCERISSFHWKIGKI